MEARPRGASDTSAQRPGLGGRGSARAKTRTAPAWVSRTEVYGPALVEDAEPRRVLGGSTAPLPGSPAGEAVPGGRGAGPPPPCPSPPGPPRSSTAAGKASRNSSSRRGRSLMVQPVSVHCTSARALGGSGDNGVTLHPGSAGGAGHARAPAMVPPRHQRRGL